MHTISGAFIEKRDNRQTHVHPGGQGRGAQGASEDGEEVLEKVCETGRHYLGNFVKQADRCPGSAEN